MKQFGNGTRQRIDAGQVGSLVQIAVDACKTKIASIIGSSMFARAYVLDVERGQG